MEKRQPLPGSASAVLLRYSSAVKVQSFTQPGEVLFNLVALIHLLALLFYSALLSQTPEAWSEWKFWMMFAGPLAFWTAIIVILVRLRRSGYRPRFRFRRGLSEERRVGEGCGVGGWRYV